MSVTVEINDSEVTSLLRRIGKAGVDARPLAAQAAARCAQDHFRTLDKSRHRAGSGTRSFYGTAADATTGRVFYWLVKKTEHKPNPSVLPTDADFEKAIVPRLQAKLDRM